MARKTSKAIDVRDLTFQDELLSLLDGLVDTIFCVKAIDHRYAAVNTAFVHRTGRTSKRDVIGRRASDLFPKELAENYDAQDARLFETRKALRDELELIGRADGSAQWYLTTKLPVLDASTGEPTCLISISRDLRMPSEDRIAIESLTRMVELVNDRFNQTLRARDLAHAAGCSLGQLDRRMKRVFGLTATQYVLRVRVEHAAERLRKSGDSLLAIAGDCGFYDQADFTRKFARLTNMTPANFRAIHRERTEVRPSPHTRHQ